MRVLITGATGLIGKAIVKQLHSKEIAVNYLTTSKNKLENTDNYKGFYWDPANNEIDLNAFTGVSGIINLAGASISKRWTSNYKAKILDSRLDSLKTLRKGLSESGNEEIISMVSASAIGIYPNSLTSLYTVDEKQIDNSFLGEVVDAWEKEIDTFESFDFSVSKIRIGLVLSKDGGALPEIAKPIKNYVGAAFGSGEQWQSWIHIQDLARIFVYILTNRLSGTFNGVAPNPVTNAKMTKEVAKVLEKPLFLPNIPEFVMKTILGEMAYILFASQRVSSKKIEEEGFKFNHLNICSALKEIYTTKNIDEESVSSLSKEYV